MSLVQPTRITLDELTVPAPDPGPADWNDDGVVILPGLIDDERIEAYECAWKRANGWRGTYENTDGVCILDADRPGGWPHCTPYRPAFIAHLSGVTHRPDMPAALPHKAGGWYFPIEGGPV